MIGDRFQSNDKTWLQNSIIRGIGIALAIAIGLIVTLVTINFLNPQPPTDCIESTICTPELHGQWFKTDPSSDCTMCNSD